MKKIEIISLARHTGELNFLILKVDEEAMVGPDYIAELSIFDDRLKINNKTYIHKNNLKEFECFFKDDKINFLSFSEYNDEQFSSLFYRNKHGIVRYSFEFRYFFQNDLLPQMKISAKKIKILSVKIDDELVYGRDIDTDETV